MITLHGTLDSLLPIRTDSNPYNRIVARAGEGHRHRYYKVEHGNHVDGLYDSYPTRLRPMLPCFRASFMIVTRWVERGRKPPADRIVHDPRGGGVNRCSVGNITYRAKSGWTTPAVP